MKYDDGSVFRFEELYASRRQARSPYASTSAAYRRVIQKLDPHVGRALFVQWIHDVMPEECDCEECEEQRQTISDIERRWNDEHHSA